MQFRIVHHTLQFKRPAKTSRNTFSEREVRYVVLTKDGISGIGEASPLSLLSIDDVEDYDRQLQNICEQLASGVSFYDLDLEKFPSIRFGLETALLDIANGGRRIIFDSTFTHGKPIQINGLVWMSDLDSMYQEAIAKITSGYRCIKFKVGAHDFDAECRLLEKIRRDFSAFKLEIRLDANGAFLPDDAYAQLADLSRFKIHSIEQPIQSGQPDDMARLCRESKIPIALDEELIGISVDTKGLKLLQDIQPQYIILKPNLIGGFTKAEQWIGLARKQEIGWWATSALESNVGLNAIAQWVGQYEPQIPQGLGTGSLYENNIASPLHIEGQQLMYTQTPWDFSGVKDFSGLNSLS